MESGFPSTLSMLQASESHGSDVVKPQDAIWQHVESEARLQWRWLQEQTTKAAHHRHSTPVKFRWHVQTCGHAYEDACKIPDHYTECSVHIRNIIITALNAGRKAQQIMVNLLSENPAKKVSYLPSAIPLAFSYSNDNVLYTVEHKLPIGGSALPIVLTQTNVANNRKRFLRLITPKLANGNHFSVTNLPPQIDPTEFSQWHLPFLPPALPFSQSKRSSLPRTLPMPESKTSVLPQAAPAISFTIATGNSFAALLGSKAAPNSTKQQATKSTYASLLGSKAGTTLTKKPTVKSKESKAAKPAVETKEERAPVSLKNKDEKKEISGCISGQPIFETVDPLSQEYKSIETRFQKTSARGYRVTAITRVYNEELAKQWSFVFLQDCARLKAKIANESATEQKLSAAHVDDAAEDNGLTSDVEGTDSDEDNDGDDDSDGDHDSKDNPNHQNAEYCKRKILKLKRKPQIDTRCAVVSVFHGTGKNDTYNVAASGVDPVLGEVGSLFGKGSYFSFEARLSNAFAFVGHTYKGAVEKSILLCYCLPGDIKFNRTAYLSNFDSRIVRNNEEIPILLLFQKSRIYPAYVISYTIS